MPPRARSKRRSARAPRAGDASAADAPTHTLTIDRLAAGGDAVAVRDDGKTVFVEDGVPGDVVRARIVVERKRFAKARIEEVLEPSADRTEPGCAHFGRCGGCAWQHVRYEAQVTAKAGILRDALERIGGLGLDADPPMTPSPSAWGYRGRARVRVEGGRVGFLERASHRHCAIEACPVLAPELEPAVLGLVEREGARDGEWSVTIGAAGEVSVVREGAAGDVTPVFLDVQGHRVGLDARAFSQANRSLHAMLAERVLAVLFEDAVDTDAWSVLEVHAGVGFFTVALAERVRRVVAVESDAHACAWLERNVAFAPVEVIPRSFEEAVPLVERLSFDAVLVDPPRTGLAPAELDALRTLAPRRIVYLSCDPATLARDLRGLVDAGYRLEHVEGFDLFPHTPHVEALVRLAHD